MPGAPEETLLASIIAVYDGLKKLDQPETKQITARLAVMVVVPRCLPPCFGG
jgi:hypothetical protein